MDIIEALENKEIQEEAKKYANSLYSQYPTYAKIAENGYVAGYKIRKRQAAISVLRLSIVALFLIGLYGFLIWLNY